MAVGIDIGGTKTHVAVRDPGSESLDLVVLSDSWRRNGLFGDAGNAARLIEIVLGMGDLDRMEPLAIGAHGCESEQDCVDFAAQVKAVYPGPVSVYNDAELLVPAAGHDYGVSVVIGTGSIVVGSSPERRMIVSGGHGWLIGDPGSAPGLTREAVKKVLTNRDRGGALDALGTRMLARFGAADEPGLIHVFNSAIEISHWGSAAIDVFAAADEGSALAAEVIDEAARALAESVRDVVERGAMGHNVVCAGGVVTNQPRMFEALRSHVERVIPSSVVELLTVPPAIGALHLATRARARTPGTIAASGPAT